MTATSGPSSAELKPRRGKLLRCTLTLKDGVIAAVRFTGDFFLMPSHTVANLEQHLVGRTPDEVAAATDMFFSSADVEMLGVAPEHFATVTDMAIKNLKGGSR